MSDWGMYELEDIVWDEFGASDDHIVPHPAGEPANESSGHGDCHKKPRHEIVSSVGRSTDSRKPVTENVFQQKETASFSTTTLRDIKAPMLEKGSWSNTHDNGDSECIDLVAGLTSEETKLADNCFESSNADAVGNSFCTDDPILGNRGAALDSSLCRFRLDDISPADSDLEFFGNEREDKESNNLLDYGWPDIGNFEDVDRMFRNCDSTFGQGSTSTANELSWFSASSHAIDASEDAFKLDFKSSCSESNGLSTTPKHNQADMKFMQSPQHGDCVTKNISDTFESSYWTSDADDPASQGFSTYASWLDGEAKEKGESASMEQLHGVNGGGAIKVSSVSQISNGSNVTGSQATDMANKQRGKSKNVIQSSDERGKDQSSGYLSGTSSLQGPGLMQQFGNRKSPASTSSAGQSFPSRQNQFPGPDFSSYVNTYSPFVNMEFGNPLHHFPPVLARSSMKSEKKNNVRLSHDVLTPASNNGHMDGGALDPQSKLPVMTPAEKIEKLRQRQKIRSQLITGHQNEQLMSQTTTDQATVLKQLHRRHEEVGGDSEVEDIRMDLPAVEADSLTVQESSCMSSALPEDSSPEATSFRQLQDVMEQLDIKTKLCIRDSLYRLARSAEQRHNFSNTEGNTRKGRGRRVASDNESKECLGFMETETDTNPIDRSIAHLLFYRPSEPSRAPANDVISLESHTVIRGPITSQLLMPDQMVSRKDGADNTDRELLSTDL